ncbi:PAS domain-containing protein [Salinarimonas sp.]|uniref:PAS domain-containing protein n=1 Tax=Salinarimonas sp. TaxID=2766526 RepID=UPI00391DB749
MFATDDAVSRPPRGPLRGPLRRLDRVVAPTNIERPFPPGALIVTKTDLAGKITYANPTFLAMARLSEAEALGAPHSIIRHPDMPRAVFAHLWAELEAGREVFAFVLNLAADGAHYWVLAHVTPSRAPDGRIVGYHSSRRPDNPRARAAVVPLYAKLREIERAAGDRRAGLEASLAALGAILQARGTTWEALVFDLARGDT